MSAWTCHLMQSSPRYEKWREILQSDEAPIISPTPIKSLLGAEMAVSLGESAQLRKSAYGRRIFPINRDLW